MHPETATEIEVWLFQEGDWISCDRLCQRFEISERRLRFLGAGFLVSRPTGGYIHRFHATSSELEAYCGPKHAHAVTELKNIKLLRRLYREQRRPYPLEGATGQSLLPV